MHYLQNFSLGLHRYFIIDQQIECYFVQYSECLSSPTYYATRIINPFLKSRISGNHDKKDELSANDKILIKGIVFLLENLFCLYICIYVNKLQNMIQRAGIHFNQGTNPNDQYIGALYIFKRIQNHTLQRYRSKMMIRFGQNKNFLS